MLMEVTWDEISQPQLAATEVFNFPELHKASIPALTFMNTVWDQQTSFLSRDNKEHAHKKQVWTEQECCRELVLMIFQLLTFLRLTRRDSFTIFQLWLISQDFEMMFWKKMRNLLNKRFVNLSVFFFFFVCVVVVVGPELLMFFDSEWKNCTILGNSKSSRWTCCEDWSHQVRPNSRTRVSFVMVCSHKPWISLDRAQRRQQQPEVAALQQQVTCLTTEVNKLNKQRTSITNDNDEIKQQLAEATSEIVRPNDWSKHKNILLSSPNSLSVLSFQSEAKFQMFALKQEITELQTQVIASPEKLKQVSNEFHFVWGTVLSTWPIATSTEHPRTQWSNWSGEDPTPRRRNENSCDWVQTRDTPRISKGSVLTFSFYTRATCRLSDVDDPCCSKWR